MKDYFHGQSSDTHKSAGCHLIAWIKIASQLSVKGFPFVPQLYVFHGCFLAVGVVAPSGQSSPDGVHGHRHGRGLCAAVGTLLCRMK